MTVIEASPGHSYRVGDLFTFEGVDIGRVESVEGNFFGKVTMRVIPTILYFAKLVEWRGKVEGLQLHLTAEPMPCHDPPVAWEVPWAMGFKVIVCPAVQEGRVVALAPGGYLDVEPVMLPAKPGRLPDRWVDCGRCGKPGCDPTLERHPGEGVICDECRDGEPDAF